MNTGMQQTATGTHRPGAMATWVALMAALLMGLTAVSAPQARAAETQTFSSTVALAFIPSSAATTLPQFDGTLGALTSVDITATLDLSLEVTVLNRSTPASTRVELAAEAALDGPGIPLPGLLEDQLSDTQTIGQDATLTFSLEGDDELATSLAPPDDLTAFVDAAGTGGQLDYTFAGGFEWSVTGPADYQADGAAVTTASITIVYTYEPAQEVDFDLDVTKTAEASLTRSIDWGIDKTVDPTEVELDDGKSGGLSKSVNYTIVVEPTVTDVASVSGTVTVTNPNDYPVTVTSIVDSIDGAEIPLDCPADLVIPAGATWDCTYEAELPEAVDGTNTVTVTAVNAELAVGGDADATADFSFGAATTEDACIIVSDDVEPLTPTPICYDDDISPITYSQTFSIEGAGGDVEFACGFDGDHVNTASYLPYTTGSETGSDSATVAVTVICEPS